MCNRVDIKILTISRYITNMLFKHFPSKYCTGNIVHSVGTSRNNYVLSINI